MDAEEVRKRLTDHIFANTKPKPYDILASVGSCGELIGLNLDIDRLMSEADRKMYADKEARRQTRE